MIRVAGRLGEAEEHRKEILVGEGPTLPRASHIPGMPLLHDQRKVVWPNVLVASVRGN